jgi:hypothetical protein
MWSLYYAYERCVNALRLVVGLVLPGFRVSMPGKKTLSGVFWVVHVLIVLAILGGLYFINVRWLHWDRYIPRTNRFLAESWLSILFLLVYILCWLSWWLFKLLAPEQALSEFPDIDDAWSEAVAALNEAGIGLTEAPLFLVLGRSEAHERALFLASQLKLMVKHVPDDESAPLHIFANHDGIYVTCPGASLLAEQAKALAGEVDANRGGESSDSGEPDPLTQTLRPGTAPEEANQMASMFAAAARRGQSPGQLAEGVRQEMRRLERRSRPRQTLLRNVAKVEETAARLEHLCRLIVRDRWPFCSVNGLLVLLPYASTDSDQDALDTGDLCQRELSIARQTLRINCPLFVMLCDMEAAPGFGEFVSRFSEAERQQRMGQRCPLVPALRRGVSRTAQPFSVAADESFTTMFESLTRWICHFLVPGWVFKKFRVESPGKADLGSVTVTNSRLFLLLDDLRERQGRLSTVLGRGLSPAEGAPPWLFGGCYLAGTGADAVREQAFVAGVFRRLPEEQNYISWTDEALAEEELYQRWIGRGYLVLALMAVATVGLGLYHFVWGAGSKPTR